MIGSPPPSPKSGMWRAVHPVMAEIDSWMSKRNERSKPNAAADPRAQRTEATQTSLADDREAVDGILVNIKKRNLNISGEQPGSHRKVPGYEIGIAIPEWEKNRSLVDSVRKGHQAQQRLVDRLQRTGAKRPWMIQQFNAIDRTVATSLAIVAERIRTRRWREKERGEALQRLQGAFSVLQRWATKTIRYCERAQRCTDPAERETVLDAACLAVLKVGEFINQVERVQHGFWRDFQAAHYLDLRRIRNLIGHTNTLEGQDVIPLGTGIVRDLRNAIERTVFPESGGPGQGGFLISTAVVRGLEPANAGEKPTPENSIAMIRLDEKNRFVINRVGRSQDNEMLVSSSVTGTMNMSVYALRDDPASPVAPPD